MNNKDKGRGDASVTDEERLLISRAAELSARSENSAVASSFLTPREQRTVFDAAVRTGSGGKLFMWGGYEGAERRMAIFLPDWIMGDDAVSEPLFSCEREKRFLEILDCSYGRNIPDEFMCAVELRGSGYAKLGHSDWLGALMALGLKRSALGDIVVSENKAVLFAKKESAGYIADELHKAGRDTVSASLAEIAEGFFAERHFDGISATVASPRLDGVVKALCSISRETASDEIAAGKVELNYFTEKRPDVKVERGDILTVHGRGKYIIDDCSQETRRGRLRLNARKYS